MSHSPPPSRARSVKLALALILAGLNLRPAMAAIGPLLDSIRHTIPLSYSLLSLLTLLPVLAMGLAMNTGSRLAARYGEHRTVAASLTLIGVSNLARLWAGGPLPLILTAISAGAGIAVVQAVLPGIVKRHFPEKVALPMGLYVTAIMSGAALAAALSPAAERLAGSWQGALASWSALAALGLAAWFMIRDEVGNRPVVATPIRDTGMARHPRAWSLGVFFGLGTASYTCVLAWLPPYFVELGYGKTHAGLMLALLTGAEVVSGLVLPALASRSPDRRPVVLAALVGVIVGFAGLILTQGALAYLWIVLLGFGIGGIFPLTLIVTLDHLPDPAHAGRLAAFVQGAGYTLASLSPLAAGIIRDTTRGFAGAWLMLAAVTVLMLFMARRFDPAGYPALFAGKPARQEG
ncbi:cyanate transporter [Paludibacterium paludis]|nr:cyanate transporter [Paludibacterium paludis]